MAEGQGDQAQREEIITVTEARKRAKAKQRRDEAKKAKKERAATAIPQDPQPKISPGGQRLPARPREPLRKSTWQWIKEHPVPLALAFFTIAGGIPTLYQLNDVSITSPDEMALPLKPIFILDTKSFLPMKNVSVDLWLDDALLGAGEEIKYWFEPNLDFYPSVKEGEPTSFQFDFTAFGERQYSRKDMRFLKFEHVYFAELFVFVHYKRLFFGSQTVVKRFITKQKADKNYTWINIPLHEHLHVPATLYDPNNRPDIDDGSWEKWMPYKPGPPP